LLFFYLELISNLKIFKKYEIWLQVREINPIWFFDATGSIHRKVNRQNKPFFYSAVCHDTIKKVIVPVAEFLTTSNSQITIGNYLSEIKLRLSICSKVNVFPKIIVTDFAWALINSVMRVFNDCTMLDYLNWCYKFVFHKEKTENDMVVYYTCSTHLIKNIIRKSKGIQILLFLIFLLSFS